MAIRQLPSETTVKEENFLRTQSFQSLIELNGHMHFANSIYRRTLSVWGRSSFPLADQNPI